MILSTKGYVMYYHLHLQHVYLDRVAVAGTARFFASLNDECGQSPQQGFKQIHISHVYKWSFL